MKRREFVQTTIATIPLLAGVPEGKGAQQRATISAEIIRLKLKHTWTTVMSSSDYRDTLHVRYFRDGITGYGEGAPIVRYNETAATGKDAVEKVRGLLESADPAAFAKLTDEVFRRIDGQYAAKAAMNIALMDWTGQKLGVPLYRYFDSTPPTRPSRHFPIGIDASRQDARQRLRRPHSFRS